MSRSVRLQCDRITRLFASFWPFKTMKICTMAYTVCPNHLKILTITKWSFSKWPKLFNGVPKWRNFDKSGHTGDLRHAPIQRRPEMGWREGGRLEEVGWDTYRGHYKMELEKGGGCFCSSSFVLNCPPIIFQLFVKTFEHWIQTLCELLKG